MKVHLSRSRVLMALLQWHCSRAGHAIVRRIHMTPFRLLCYGVASAVGADTAYTCSYMRMGNGRANWPKYCAASPVLVTEMIKFTIAVALFVWHASWPKLIA